MTLLKKDEPDPISVGYWYVLHIKRVLRIKALSMKKCQEKRKMIAGNI
jgi:hypothetical protein